MLSYKWRVAEPIPSKKWKSTRKEATALHPHMEKDSEKSRGGPAPAAIRTESSAFQVPSNTRQCLPPLPAPTSPLQGYPKPENQKWSPAAFQGHEASRADSLPLHNWGLGRCFGNQSSRRETDRFPGDPPSRGGGSWALKGGRPGGGRDQRRCGRG